MADDAEKKGSSSWLSPYGIGAVLLALIGLVLYCVQNPGNVIQLGDWIAHLGHQPGLPKGTTGWAYFGRWGNGPRDRGWKQVYFTLDMNNPAPDSGETSAREEQAHILDAPQLEAPSKGVLQRGQIVKFENVQRMTDGQIWAFVTVQ
jgi:hypothetical protein